VNEVYRVSTHGVSQLVGAAGEYEMHPPPSLDRCLQSSAATTAAASAAGTGELCGDIAIALNEDECS